MGDESEIIQSVYAVAVDPERYDDLVTTWVAKLSSALFAYQDNPDDPESAAFNEHIAQASRVISLLAASRADDAPAPGASTDQAHSDAQPVMGINEDGELLKCNASATQAYGVNPGDHLTDLPFNEGAQRTIHALANRLVREQSNPTNSGGSLVHAVRDDTGQTVYLSLILERTGELNLTSTDIVWPERLNQLMSDSFGLTKAECDVGQKLVEGASVQEIAESRSSSLATVRAQARALFSKTSTNSQREFIRMAIGLASLYPDMPESVPTQSNDAQPHSILPLVSDWQSFRLDDGRALPYAILGSPTGRPCLYIHDGIFGPTLPRELVEQATAANLKLIIPARQGWFGAPNNPPGSNAFLQCASDTKELMRYLDLQGVLLLPRILGATYAFEIQRADSSRYVGIVGICPALPFGAREDMNRMAPHHRLLTISVGTSPAILKFVTRAGIAIYERFGAERFLRMVYRSSKEDLKLIDNPATLALMAAALAARDGRGKSEHPFYKELRDRPSEHWHPSMSLGIPFHALLGEHDPSARKRRAERLIDNGVDLTLTLLPDAGELFIYSHPEVIIEAITTMLERTSQGGSGSASVASE